MKIKKKKSEVLEGDLTPMIDMTFQLIAFFMVLINFAQTDQNERVKLPESELAKPPEAPLENSLTLQMLKNGNVYFDGVDFTLDSLKSRLVVERQIADDSTKEGVTGITVVVRAHKEVETGKVQQMIKLCQDEGFEKFTLRAKETVPDNF